jgi:hypothetical protein
MADPIFTAPPNVATPESVALALLQAVMKVEGKNLTKGFDDSADRKYLLDTYAECLRAVQNPRSESRGHKPG